jgi:hypothetical protein
MFLVVADKAEAPYFLSAFEIFGILAQRLPSCERLLPRTFERVGANVQAHSHETGACPYIYNQL